MAVSQRFARIVLFAAPFAVVAFSAYVAMAQKPVVPRPSITIVPIGTFRSDQPVPVAPMPVPVQSVVSFESAFVSQLNTAIRNPQALTQGKKGVVVIVDHTAWRSFVVDRAIVVITSARVMPRAPAHCGGSIRTRSRMSQPDDAGSSGPAGARGFRPSRLITTACVAISRAR